MSHPFAAQVTTFRRGGSFGEVALIREQPRAATVTAITSAVCWRLERSLFRKLSLIHI